MLISWLKKIHLLDDVLLWETNTSYQFIRCADLSQLAFGFIGHCTGIT